MVKKEDFKSFGIDFSSYIIISMSITFATMMYAIMKYHNRTRENLRPAFSVSSLMMLLVWTLVLTTKVSVYIVGFLNTPGFIFVPIVVRIFASACLLHKFVPVYRNIEHHHKLVYLLISFLVPVSIPTRDTKQMRESYTISLGLFFLECSMILCFACLIKNVYHFKSFGDLYIDFPHLIKIDKVFSFVQTFDNLICVLLLAVSLVTLLSQVALVIATKVSHPKSSLFKNSSAFQKPRKARMISLR